MNPVYVFKQSVSFGKGLLFQKGTHRVDPKVSALPYFQKLVRAGLVVKAGEVAPKGAAAIAPPPTKVAAQQKAAIDAQQAARKAKAAEAPVEEADEEAKPAKSGKKGK